MLLASSNTLDGIMDMIGQYWYTKDISLQEMTPKDYIIIKDGKNMTQKEGNRFIVTKKRKRFCFESIED